MTRAERSRLVMRLAWQIFRSSDGVSHSEAMKLAHQQVERKLNPDRASEKIRQRVREQFEAPVVKHVEAMLQSDLRKANLVPVNIAMLPTGDIKLSSVYRKAWTSSHHAKSGAGFPHGCGRNKSEIRSIAKQQNKRFIQVSRDEKRSLIPPDMRGLAPVYKGHTTYHEYQ